MTRRDQQLDQNTNIVRAVRPKTKAAPISPEQMRERQKLKDAATRAWMQDAQRRPPNQLLASVSRIMAGRRAVEYNFNEKNNRHAGSGFMR